MSNPSARPERQSETALAEKTRTARPRRFHVILHNDDYTTQQFVVEILMRYFAMPETEATRVMLDVHTKGRGIAGTYPRDLAETKVAQVVRVSRAAGMPLMLTAEPAEE